MNDIQTPGAEFPQMNEDVIAIPGDQEQSIYRFIIVAAKRARQLQSGSRPKVQAGSRKMTRVAVEEVRRGMIPFMDPETTPIPEEPPEEPISEE